MKKLLFALALSCAVATPTFASVIKPLNILNLSDKAMLAASVSDAKIDLKGSIFGITPLREGQGWSSTITVNSTTQLNIVVIEDDGFSLGTVLKDNPDVKVVCAVVADQNEDKSKGVFSNARIKHLNSNYRCVASDDGTSLQILPPIL